MNRRLGSVFLFALLVSAGASFLVYHFVVLQVEAASRHPQPKRKLLVAAKMLPAGHLIETPDLRWISSPASAPEGAINDIQQALGRGVIATIYPSEAIAEGRLAPRGAGAGLASMIPVGKRAAALKIDEVIGLAGFVVPGMRVDVLVSGGNNEAGRNGVLARTVLQNIEVLSAGQKIEKTADGKPQDAQVVNLLVTPDQAEVLSLASSEAKVQLVLRNPLDTTQEKTHGTSVAALFGLSEAPRPMTSAAPARIATPKAPSTTAPTVEVFSGTKRSEQALN
jgi:pilus assembly protein CpaB